MQFITNPFSFMFIFIFYLSYIFFKLIFIGVQLLYNVVQFLQYNKMNQLYIYVYPLFFGFSYHLGHHGALEFPVLYSYVACIFFLVTYTCINSTLEAQQDIQMVACIFKMCLSSDFLPKVFHPNHFLLRWNHTDWIDG